ncbi:MAG: winged helix-turn-helix domain-containing protein [Bacteroidota bacterium]
MGKRLNYTEQIKESEDALQELERQQSEAIFRDRIRYIRYLKSGLVTTQKAASQAIGLSLRQGQRNWRIYREQGIEGLLRPIEHPGAPTKLNTAEFEELEKRLEGDDIQFLHEAVSHVKEKYGKEYTLSGMHYVFKRIKVKKKTGRPVNIRQDKEGLEAFKKTSPR